MKTLFTYTLTLIGIAITPFTSANEYAPQTVHINKNIIMSIPRSWTRRPNVPFKNLAALFAPNMDMNLPNLSIFVIRHPDTDARAYVRTLVQNTSHPHVFALREKALGNDTAVFLDMSANRQEVIKEKHLLWRQETIKNHSTRSIHTVFENHDTLFVISCSAASDVHIRDCQLIMASLKAHSLP